MACGSRGMSTSSVASSYSTGGRNSYKDDGLIDDDVGRFGKNCMFGDKRGRRCGVGDGNRIGGPSSIGYNIEPIIRRGTHARVKAIERAIDAFLSLTILQPLNDEHDGKNDADGGVRQQKQRQIVILGSGRDTNYLRYTCGNKKKSLGKDEDNDATNQNTSNSSNNNNSALGDNVRWYEVDHPSVMSRKAREWLPKCVLPNGYTYRCDAVHGNAADGESNIQDDSASYAVNIVPSEHGNSDREGMLNWFSTTTIPTQTNKPNYHLIGHDLRSPPSELFEKLSRPTHGFDKSCPTLFVLECVLMYLPECSVRDLIRCIAESPCSGGSTDGGSFVAIAVYDPIPSYDRFGRTMIDNLHKAGIASTGGEGGCDDSGNRGIVGMRSKGSSQVFDDENENNDMHRLGLVGTRTLLDQLSRLVHSGGFDLAVGCDMMSAYNHGVIPEEERRIAARCEMLDELEEFVLLMEHYCFVVGVAFPRGNGNMASGFWDAERLCSIGDESPIGFQEGHCTIMRSDR